MSFLKFDDDKELIAELKGTLGEPMVKVELDSSQWTLVVKNTQRWFMAKKGILAMVKKEYDGSGLLKFSDVDSANGCYKVLDVIPDASRSGGPLTGSSCNCSYYEILPNGFPLWGGLTSSSFFTRGSFNGTSYLMQIAQAVENRNILYGAGFDWKIMNDHLNGHGILIHPHTAQTVYVVYKPKILPINILEGRDAQLFFDWALADAKEKLGRVRSKYKSYPGAGGTLDMDGDTLLEEAKASKEDLEIQIAGSQGTMPILFG